MSKIPEAYELACKELVLTHKCPPIKCPSPVVNNEYMCTECWMQYFYLQVIK